MTSPKHAHATETRGRYYTHPVTGQQLVSVTNVLGTGVAKYGIPAWYARLAAEYALDNLPRIVTMSRTDRDGAIKEIKGYPETVRDRKGDLGTRIHDQAEAHLTGRALLPDDEAAPYVKQYEKFLTDFDVDLDRDVISTELTVANPALGLAGTLDILLMLRLDGYVEGKVKLLPGEERALFLIDIKTSETRSSTECYPENALQLTALRHATEMWLPDDSIVPMMRGIKGAAVLSLRKKTYELIPLPSGPAEFAAFKGALTLTKWVHQWPGNYDYRPVTPAGAFKPKRGGGKKTTPTTLADDTEKVA